MYSRWINFYDLDLYKKRDYSELIAKFESEYKSYCSFIDGIEQTSILTKEQKKSLYKNHISANGTSYSQKIENNNIDEDIILVNTLIDGLSYVEHLTTNQLFYSYKESVLKLPLTVKTIKDSHKYINIFNKKIKPGITRSNRANSVNVEIKGADIIFVEYQFVSKHLNKLVKYIDKSEDHFLVKSAILHAYLVGIHPFIDGNGRISRYISDKYLSLHLDKEIYPSQAIYSTLNNYYDTLQNFFFKSDVYGFVKFYIESLIHQMSLDKVAIVEEFKSTNNIVNLTNNSGIADKYLDGIIDLLLVHKGITVISLVNRLNITKITAKTLVNKLIEANIVDNGEKIGRTVVYRLKNNK